MWFSRLARAIRREPLRWLAVGAILLVAWLLLSGFPVWGVVLGVAALVGIVLATRKYQKSVRDVVGCFLVFPAALLETIAPLLLAVLVLTLYATQEAAAGFQIAAALGVAAAVALTFDAELRPAGAAFRQVARNRWLWLLFGAVLLLPSLAALAFAFLPSRPLVAEIGGAPVGAQAAALLLLLAAGVVRFVAFSRTSRWRFALVGVLALVTVMIAAIWGYFPGSDGETAAGLKAGVWGVIALAALLALAAYEALVRLRTDAPSGPPSLASVSGIWLRLIGFACAFAGVAGLVLALALVEFEQRGWTTRRTATTNVDPGMPSQAPSSLGDRELANMFAPVLAFQGADKEPWLPTTVNRFVNDARLLTLAGNACPPADCKPNPRLFALPRTCKNGAELCYVLSCAKGDGACAGEQGGIDPDHTAVYARVARKEREPRTFRGVTPFDGESPVTIVVQYWLFYPHNRWRAVTPVGYLVQEHEGDWEAITLGFADDRPLFAAYSSHCGGKWYRWDDIEVEAAEYDGSPPWRVIEGAETGLHPLVAVATGSHANYLGAWRGRPPDWGTCRGVPGSAIGALSYASNVRDRTGRDRTIYPAFVKLVGAGHPAMAFAGRWGLSEVTSIEALRKKRIAKPGKGPESPSFKALWRRPLVTIFCTRYWSPRIDCGETES